MGERPPARLPFLARWVIAAYPPWWRERYGEDQEMFLEDAQAESRGLLGPLSDLAVGAIRVRLRPTGMPETVRCWRDRTRACIAWATVPALAGLLLIGVISERTFGSSSFAGGATLSTGGRVASAAMSALAMTSLLLGACLLSGWALVALAGGRGPDGRASRRWLLLVAAPFIGGGLEIALFLGQSLLDPGTVTVLGHALVVKGGHPLVASVLGVAWDVVAVLWILSVFCVVAAARRAELEVRDLRGGVWLSQLTAALLVLAALGALAWGIGVTHQPPIPRADLLGYGSGPWTGVRTSLVAEWPLIFAGLAGVSAVASRGALSARRGYRRARELSQSEG